jgi:CHAT domain-containing protein/pimeloyl-ACP methyl ester carboxylesterase
MAAKKRPRAKTKPRRPARVRAAESRDLPVEPAAILTRHPAPKESVFNLKIDEIERRLAEGEIDAELEVYFGPQLPELRQLARDARATTRAARGPRPKALVLPGIMGSTLGFKRALGLFHDTVWLDPLDTLFGRLGLLTIPSTKKKIIALDPFPLVYLGLRLALKSEGFDADYFPFDWRLSLGELGAALKAKLATMGPGKVHLAAHSMGGLVARAALKQGASNIGTVVMMGTPNHGSYSPVLAFRGVHDLASKIAGLDLASTSVELTEKVFSTFTGLAQMLPFGPIAYGRNWHDATLWPVSPQVRPAVLEEAANVTSLLAPAPANWHLIAGVDQETIVRAEADPNGSGLRYQRDFRGDGTVPLDSAILPELAKPRIFFVKHAHGTLTMNRDVKAAVVQLLKGESVTTLKNEMPAVRPAPEDWLTDAQMASRSRATAVVRAAPAPPTVAEAATRLRMVLDAPLGTPEVLAPQVRAVPLLSAQAAAVGGTQPLRGVVVSRETQLYLEIELAQGDIAEVESDAIVLARFQNMDLGRAAQSVDACMDGVLADMVARRMFDSNVGEMFVLPTGRHTLRADVVAIAGLGPMDALLRPAGGLAWETLELVAENTLRTLLSAGVSEFATVLFGNIPDAGPALMREGLTHFMQGFLRGLADARDRRRFRRVTLCEADPVRFASLRQALLDLLPTPLFDSVQVRLDERTLPPPRTFLHRSLGATAAGEAGRDPAYLFIRALTEDGDVIFDTTLVQPRGRAATPRESQRVTRAELQSILDPVKPTSWNDPVTSAEVLQSGERIARLLLHPAHREVLAADRDTPIILVHDDESSRIPWETLRLGKGGDYLPAAGAGITRQYAASNLSVAKWLEARRQDEKLRVLLVVNPTGDLDGAEEEGERVEKLFKDRRDVICTPVRGDEATRPRLLELFRSGKFDVVHYAGHAFFDPTAPDRSGLICAPPDQSNPSVLSGADLAGLGQLPMLIFLNACESARVRGLPDRGGRKPNAAGKKQKKGKQAKHPDRVRAAVSAAEALMRGGVANFVGTYWPVGDAAALDFATSFYASVLAGEPLGPSVTKARKKVHEGGSGDWADYIHYGSPNFVLKPRQS